MNTTKKITGLTEMEKQVLKSLESLMYAEYNFSDVGATDLSNDTGIEMKSIRGVLSSLSKKGLVNIESREDNFGFRKNDPSWEAIVYLAGDAEGLHEEWQEEVGFASEIA
jgi:predicted transcriptional regulator